jgi:hypothetical protein
MATSTSTQPKRIDVRVPADASPKQARELGAFARYCVQRIEKDLGERQEWTIAIEIGGRGYAAQVEVRHAGFVLGIRGFGNDGPLAVWDAMCRIEEALRVERVAARAGVAND